MVSFSPNVFLFTGHFFPGNVFRPLQTPPLKVISYLEITNSFKGLSITRVPGRGTVTDVASPYVGASGLTPGSNRGSVGDADSESEREQCP